MKLITPLMFAAAVAATSSATTAAAATCADRTAVVERLVTRFGETAVANAVSVSNNILEVHASEDLATWTILLTLPEENLTCLVASGAGETAFQASLQSF